LLERQWKSIDAAPVALFVIIAFVQLAPSVVSRLTNAYLLAWTFGAFCKCSDFASYSLNFSQIRLTYCHGWRNRGVAWA